MVIALAFTLRETGSKNILKRGGLPLYLTRPFPTSSLRVAIVLRRYWRSLHQKNPYFTQLALEDIETIRHLGRSDFDVPNKIVPENTLAEGCTTTIRDSPTHD